MNCTRRAVGRPEKPGEGSNTNLRSFNPAKIGGGNLDGPDMKTACHLYFQN